MRGYRQSNEWSVPSWNGRPQKAVPAEKMRDAGYDSW